MNNGFMQGYDPCYGYDDDPRSPYHRDTRESTGETCAICGEPILEGDEIVCDEGRGHQAHYECFKQADYEDLLTYIGYQKTVS